MAFPNHNKLNENAPQTTQPNCVICLQPGGEILHFAANFKNPLLHLFSNNNKYSSSLKTLVEPNIFDKIQDSILCDGCSNLLNSSAKAIKTIEFLNKYLDFVKAELKTKITKPPDAGLPDNVLQQRRLFSEYIKEGIYTLPTHRTDEAIQTDDVNVVNTLTSLEKSVTTPNEDFLFDHSDLLIINYDQLLQPISPHQTNTLGKTTPVHSRLTLDSSTNSNSSVKSVTSLRSEPEKLSPYPGKCAVPPKKTRRCGMKSRRGVNDKDTENISTGYKCPKCWKTFYSEPNQDDYMLECCETCLQSSLLKEVFECIYCHAYFLCQSECVEHEVTSHQDKIVSVPCCTICLKDDFQTAESLLTHVQSEHSLFDESGYQCEVCSKYFQAIDELTKHQSLHFPASQSLP